MTINSGFQTGRLLSRVLFALAGLLLVGHFLVYVNYAVGVIRFPFDYDQGEGFELVDTIMFSEGKWPYQNNEVYPYYASNYPPLFHVMLVPFVWLFGEAYWYGRLVGFLGTLVTAAVIGVVVYRAERHRLVAIFSGLAFLASNYIYHIGPLFRQHMTMVMFETLAVATLAYAVSEARSHQWRWMGLGLLFLLAAGYTKQHAVATSVAVFVFLFLRNPRRSLLWGLAFVGVAAGIFVWIDVATGGAWWTNIIAANVNDYYPSQFLGLLQQWLRLHGALILPAVGLVVYELYFTRLSLYAVWWVFAVASTVLSGKWGAGDSYFATAIAATCILSGIAAGRTLRAGWHFPDDSIVRKFAPARRMVRWGDPGERRQWLAVIVPALYLVYALSVVKLPTEGRVFGPLADVLGLQSSYGTRYAFYDAAGWTQGYASIGHVPDQGDIDRGWEIVERVRQADGPVMSEEAAFSLKAGKDVVTNPTQLKNLYENQLFDPANLVADIQQQRFGLIVFRAQFYPPPVLAAVYEAYFPAERIEMDGFHYEIWYPGPVLPERELLTRMIQALEPGERREGHLTLPLKHAVLWLDHVLATSGWEPATAPVFLSEEDGCAAGNYVSDGQNLVVSVCDEGEYAQVVLTLEAGQAQG